MPPDADKHSKTEAATGKKLNEAREKGQVAKSQDLSATVAMIAGLCAISLYLPKLVLGIKVFFISVIKDYNFADIEGPNIDAVFHYTVQSIGILGLPIILVVWVSCLVASTVQVGFHISTKALTPSLDKLNVINGFKNLISFKSIIKTGMSIAKMIFIAVIAGSVLFTEDKVFTIFALNDINLVINKSAALLWELIFKVSMTLFIMAVIDYFYQKWQFSEDMKMTKQEVQDEHKQQEGNPTIKGRIRSIQRAAASKRGLQQSVSEADVVVVNPFHIAVALKYDRESGNAAPIVVAKGARLLASRIKEFAKESKIEIIQNVPLARALYKQCRVGLEISPDLYIAVAEVLAIVFKKREKKF